MNLIDHPTVTSDEKPRLDWHTVWQAALKHRPQLVRAHLVAFLAALASIPVPLLIPLLVDEVLLDRPGPMVELIKRVAPADWQGPVLYIGAVLLATFVLRLISLGLLVDQARRFTWISKDIVFQLRRRLLEHLETISMSEYEVLGSGKVVTHLVTDLETLDLFIGSTVSRLLVAILSILGTAIVLLWIHWQLALFILILNPLVIYFTVALGKQVKHLKKRENTAFELFQQALVESLDGIQQIRAANREEHYIGKLIDAAFSVKQHAAKYSWRSDAAHRLSFLVFMFGIDLFRTTAMLMVLFSGLTIGKMLAVFGYLWFMMAPVQEVLGIQYAYYAARAAMKRIQEILNLCQEPRPRHLKNPFKNHRTVGIGLTDVHFGYGDGPEILKGISLEIAAGEKVALVGASGAGKSTLVQVLIGLYAPRRGNIHYAGVPIDEIGADVVREHVATVLQHPAIFNDTVRENLRMGRKMSDTKLWQALSVAQLAVTIEGLPQGLDSGLGRSGIRLSGGQRQRLAIARMVLADPSVVILDEATSALDAETEFRLHQQLDRFLTGRTTIIIAHRLSAVKQAERVFVFEDGLISEQGEPATLLSGQGLYAKLYGSRQQGT
ncbi:MAG: ABC transporter ATP-binding protein [Gammaproteobacteria bacterium]